MGRKSCKKQQKWRQQQQLPLGDVDPSYVVDGWCPGCGEFGHTVAICPTQYQGQEWGLEVGEVGHVLPDYNHSQPQEEEVGLEPQPQEEDGWEALLRSMGVQYSCCICGELGHFPANCPLPPVRDLLYPPTPAEGEFLLVPPPPPTAEAEQQERSLRRSRAARAVSVSTAVTSRGRVPAGATFASRGRVSAGPTTTSRGSMPAGSASIAATSTGIIPAGFTAAARRGGAPAAFAARRGGAPAAFAA
ncbi:UNVERIFIED_CONTAM: hypothetical protein FKN15_072709 [Acipenser sinensis]